MRNVRLYYKKTGRMKFVSHLDMTRFMSRLIAKSKIPVWYTEGFNKHIYMNFALPLSLGYVGLYEIMDIRIIDPQFTDQMCLEALKQVSTPDIEFFAVSEQGNNMKEIGWAEFSLEFQEPSEEMFQKISEFLEKPNILCLKTGKKGKVKEIDLIPKIKSFGFDGAVLKLCLIAGAEDNLNPTLLMNTFFEQTETPAQYYTVTRTNILDKNGYKFI